ncbi:MAG: helix-turn-helix transcriptional regulator [Clostridia bacterium]|nr:helix-turn-helix transcriptional regulator [Clostridia bacterium]
MNYEIGGRIAKYRKAKNLSQREFAKLIGVSNTRVSNWEQGSHRPDVDILSDICNTLEVSPSELLDIHLSADEFTEKEIRIINAYRTRKDMQKAVDTLLNIND